MADGNELGIFSKALSGAQAGYSIGGGWGALIGGLAGLGMGAYESTITKKPYTVKNFMTNSVSSSGFVEGLKGIERKTELVPNMSVSKQQMKYNDLSSGFNAITSAANIVGSLTTKQSATEADQNNDGTNQNIAAFKEMQKLINPKPLVESKIDPKRFNYNFQNYVPGAQKLTNTLNQNDIEFEWSNTMKEMRNNFPNMFT